MGRRATLHTSPDQAPWWKQKQTVQRQRQWRTETLGRHSTGTHESSQWCTNYSWPIVLKSKRAEQVTNHLLGHLEPPHFHGYDHITENSLFKPSVPRRRKESMESWLKQRSHFRFLEIKLASEIEIVILFKYKTKPKCVLFKVLEVVLWKVNYQPVLQRVWSSLCHGECYNKH